MRITAGKPVTPQQQQQLIVYNPSLYQQAIVSSGYVVQAAPSSEAEAQAQGKTTYIPEEQKQQYYEQVKQSYMETEAYKQQTTQPNQKTTEKAEATAQLAQRKQALSLSPTPTPEASRSHVYAAPSGEYPAYVSGIPPPQRYRYENLTPQEKQAVDKTTRDIIISAAGLGGFVASPTTALIGGFTGLGLTQGFKAASGQGWLTEDEAALAFVGGEVFGVVGKGVTTGLGFTGYTARSIAGRIGTNVGLGAGSGYVTSGGDLTEAGKGALFGLGFGVIGEGVGFGLSKLRGYKVTRVTGATEIEKQIMNEQGMLKGKTLTELHLTRENVPRGYGKYLDEYGKYFIPDEIELGGKERLVAYGAPETEMRSSLIWREADPYLSAARGKSSVTVKGVVTEGLAAQRTYLTTAKAPGKVYMETVIAGFNPVHPEKVLLMREFTAVQLWGKIDRQIYLNYLKNVPTGIGQDWLRQMGGLSYVQLTKPQASSTLRVFTNILGYQQKTVTIPSISGYYPTVKPQPIATVERKPSKTTQTFTVPTYERTRVEPVNTAIVTAEQKRLPTSTAIYTRSFNMPTFETAPAQVPKTANVPSLIPAQSTRLTPGQTPKQPPRQTTPTVPLVPSLVPSAPKMKIPYFGRGGGFDFLRQRRIGFSKHFIKRNQLKSYKDMLRTFGLGISRSKQRRKRRR